MPVTKDNFLAVLADGNALWPEKDFASRSVDIPLLPGKATVLIGIRRAGKTTLMRQLAIECVARGDYSSPQIVFVNFSDERLFGLTSSDLKLLIEAHYQLHPQLSKEQGLAFFLDEIQLVAGWELFVDRIVRDRRNRVILSGSSAKLLSSEIATEMRGRAISFEVFPFSFREYLTFHAIPMTTHDEKGMGRIAGSAARYLEDGGFPEVQKLSKALQHKILQDYLHMLYARDIIERHNPSNPFAVRTFLNLALNNIAAPFTFNKTSKRLKSVGLSVPPAEVGEYLSWAEDCYLLWSVPILSESLHKRNTNPKKLYCVDSGLFNAISQGTSPQIGPRLENAVFGVLRRRAQVVHYYRTQEGGEVDFVVNPSSSGVVVVQVSAFLVDDKTREREFKAVVSACRDFGIGTGYVVTLNEDRLLKQDGITIEVMSFGKFALAQV